MPRLVERIWQGSGYGSRPDRLPFRYHAYVPDPIAELDPELPGAAAQEVAAAEAALATLAASTSLPSLEALAAPLLRAEALGSSHIEGYRVSNKRLAVAAYAPQAGDATATTVLANVRAMTTAMAIADRQARLKVRDLLDIHRTLMEGTSHGAIGGTLRRVQNWVGGRSFSPRGAAFVPPPEDCVPGLMDDLAAFCNRDDLPAVVQAAVAHAQFETIHPFADGNGRTGRCLVHVVLRRREVARLMPPVSIVLAADAARYIAGLGDYRAGRMADWIGHFAAAVGASARAAQVLGERLSTLSSQLIDRAGRLRPDAVARRIIEGLPSCPIVSADSAAMANGVTATTARRALNQLAEAGVLQLTRVGRRRDREWSCDALFDVLDAFEFEIAEPASGVRRRPAPTRHRRARPTGGRARGKADSEAGR